MRLKMLTGLCGPTISLTRGDSYSPDSDHEAIRLIDARFADAVDPAEEAKVRAIVEAEWAAAAETEGTTDGAGASEAADATAGDIEIDEADEGEQTAPAAKKAGQGAKK